MLKDLIKLANHLDGRGFTKEADIIDNIIRKSAGELEDMIAGEMDYDSGEMPKPILAPVEQQGVDYPVFNSDESTTDFCEDLKKAALGMYGTYKDLDKFYAAAKKFGEVINNTNPKGIRILIPPKYKVRMGFDKYGSFGGSFFRLPYYKYDKEGFLITRSISIPREQHDILHNLDGIVRVISEDVGFSLGHNKIANLVLDLGYDKDCIKEIYTAPFRSEARPDDPYLLPSQHEKATKIYFDNYLNSKSD